ncbi:DUF5018 domain-containing protein [Zobellia uliginosa]|uniref:DUF5018 domain-containing protein n=1 Tax=Zobellia uliginosa TaxID=143224 RepID=UPI001C077828|nr:DUF5018 domain-containing protein [Zobellia uliginosa]MBU2946703.1 DUF5018 domain-containing protein [Zobellia uliginosa]
MKLSPLFRLSMCLLLIFASCSKDSDETVETQSKSNKNEVLEFNISIQDTKTELVINSNEIRQAFPSTVDLTSLTPEIVISEKATISPKSGVTQDFSKEVTYTVTAENGTTNMYKVNLTNEEVETENKNVVFSFMNLPEGRSNFNHIKQPEAEADSIQYRIPYLSNIPALKLQVNLPEGAKSVPESDETLDFTNPVTYTVTFDSGDTKKYIISVDNRLDQVKLPPFSINMFADKAPGETITFNAYPTNPILDSVKVNLINSHTRESTPLIVEKIENISYNSDAVTARLPESYLNGRYEIEIFIEHDNSTETNDSDLRFTKGTPNFKYASVNGELDRVISRPGGHISANLYLDHSRLEDYTFSLKKDGIAYEFTNATYSSGSGNESFVLTLPDLDTADAPNGMDYKFAIHLDGETYEYDLIDYWGEAIAVVSGGSPKNASINKNIYTKGDMLTVTGENLYFENKGEYIFRELSEIILISTEDSGKDLLYRLGTESTSENSLSLRIPDEVQSGSYELRLRNNLIGYNDNNDAETGIEIEVLQPASTHPTLVITEAIIGVKPDKAFYRQANITFNQNIEGLQINEILFVENSLSVKNFLTYPSSIVTGEIENEYLNQMDDKSDGKVLVTDNGVTYEIPFSIVFQH